MGRLPLLAVLLAALLLALAGCGSDEPGTQAAAEAVEIVATDFAFEPSTLDLEAGGAVSLRLANEGQAPHALAFEGADVASDQVAAGGSTEVTVELEPGSYTMFCPVANHRDLGMEGTLVVVGGAASGAPGTTEPDDDPGGYGYG